MTKQVLDVGVTWIDGFLDADECEFICAELDFAFWRPSRVVNRLFGDELVYYRSAERTSVSTDQQWFNAELDEAVAGIERRVCEMLRVDSATLEPWQAVRYRNRGRFQLHHDAGLFACDPEGERELTVLLYLETPPEGGATVFPDLRVRVTPVAGRLVVWRNLRDDGTVDPAKRHAAQPVRRGRKTILTTWSRQHPVRKETHDQ
ncbi:prolyl hydroxylase family protein [Mycolicibacterium stellerae]|uniref:prolyl hydroxylase family protein n=1 Tax=Mycolicibacterium stellerae TaxID=2358193 RepID=UPI0013DDB5E0|nr:2OG-Fe(II) oxygenase [Mycolicibacterium stellerae]